MLAGKNQVPVGQPGSPRKSPEAFIFPNGGNHLKSSHFRFSFPRAQMSGKYFALGAAAQAYSSTVVVTIWASSRRRMHHR